MSEVVAPGNVLTIIFFPVERRNLEGLSFFNIESPRIAIGPSVDFELEALCCCFGSTKCLCFSFWCCILLPDFVEFSVCVELGVTLCSISLFSLVVIAEYFRP